MLSKYTPAIIEQARKHNAEAVHCYMVYIVHPML